MKGNNSSHRIKRNQKNGQGTKSKKKSKTKNKHKSLNGANGASKRDKLKKPKIKSISKSKSNVKSKKQSQKSKTKKTKMTKSKGNTQSSTPFFDTMADVLLINVFLYCSFKDFMQFHVCCKRFRNIGHNTNSKRLNNYWKSNCHPHLFHMIRSWNDNTDYNRKYLKSLIQNDKIDVNLHNDCRNSYNESSPLWMAIKRGAFDAVDILINSDKLDVKKILKSRDMYGMTLMHYACQEGNSLSDIKIIYQRLKKGIKKENLKELNDFINAKDSGIGKTALMLACENKKITIKMIEYLINVCKADTSILDINNQNYICYAERRARAVQPSNWLQEKVFVHSQQNHYQTFDFN